MKLLLRYLLFWLISCKALYSQQLKSVIYDFDGFDLGQTNLPEGDYSYGDIQYKIVSPPQSMGAGMIGDRCLEINLNWNLNYAAFGRGISRFIALEQSQDFLNFYFLNASSQTAQIELVLADDDNQTTSYEASGDDSWRTSLSIPFSSTWQLISLPLSQFVNVNQGGNNKMDFGFSPQEGMLLLCEFKFTKPSGSANSAVFFIDQICFSEGPLKTGNLLTELPTASASDYCRVGAFMPTNGDNFINIPQQVEAYFSPLKKISYVNTFLQWSQNNLLVPNALPGNGIQTLLNAGYKPIITWEPSYLSLSLLDTLQPNLQQILNGNFDVYLDNFGDAMANYTDTVIIRLMHEFDGDWYPWSISKNGQDPQRFAAAFRYIVDRVRNRGATKVKWMWCPNSDYAPYQAFNWFVNAYPGNQYVDYTGTDIYNGHYPAALPWWRSFRWIAAESYYYLQKYFPSKPIIICELGCRERVSNDDQTSQSKADWFKEMDKQLQGQFTLVRGLVFFNTSTGAVNNWQMNSSAGSLSMLQNEIWDDNYYFPNALILKHGAIQKKSGATLFPNPAKESIQIKSENLISWQIFASEGRLVLSGNAESIDLRSLQNGFYFIRIVDAQSSANLQLLLAR